MRIAIRAVAASFALLLTAACASDAPVGTGTSPSSPSEKPSGSITVYSGRGESLLGDFYKSFEAATSIKVNVKYGDTAELAATILEEGDRSPADVYFGQDAGALGALEQAGRFAELPEAIVTKVPAAFRSTTSRWVGASGRARVIAFNPTITSEDEVPDSVLELTDAKWRGKVGWAPTNGSFQSFVTAMRLVKGEDATKKWLQDMKANGTKVFPNNGSIVEAIHEGEVTLGLVNHYYAFEMRDEVPNAKVRDHFLPGGDVGALVNVAGVGVLKTSKNPSAAQRFVEFVVSPEGQRYFATKTFEYPLIDGVDAHAELPKLETLEPPAVDLTKLADLQGTLALLREVGLP